MRYFKKLVPSTRVIVGNAQVQFKTHDNAVGYFATDNQALSAAFEDHMRNGRYGLSEISADEFTSEYLQKKIGAISNPTWREEFSGAKSLAQSMSGASSAVAVGAARDTVVGKPDEPGAAAAPVVAAPKPPPAPTPEVSTVALPTKETVHAPEKPDFQPTVGKRKRGRRSFSD